MCEAAVGRRIAGIFVVQGGGSQRGFGLSLGEGVSGAGRGRVTESRGFDGEPAETSRSGAREDFWEESKKLLGDCFRIRDSHPDGDQAGSIKTA